MPAADSTDAAAATPTVVLQYYEPTEVSDDFLRPIHAISVERELEFMPDDPPEPFAQFAAIQRASLGEYRTVRRWVASIDGEVVGACSASVSLDQPDLGFVQLMVARANRSGGVGKTMLAAALDWASAEGRSKFLMAAPLGSHMEPALERLGMSKAMRERLSRLDTADLDGALMTSWVERARERAADYELVEMDERVPDEFLDRWCAMEEAMNTAPTEDLDIEDEAMEGDKWRQMEKQAEERGARFRGILAIHSATGEAAGLTTLLGQRLHPGVAYQDDTVVHPDHRNKGLGRWIKAANILRFLEEFPGVRHIYTGNADSNEPMLNINVAMGFREAAQFVVWQGTVAAAEDHLGAV